VPHSAYAAPNGLAAPTAEPEEGDADRMFGELVRIPDPSGNFE
jgi:hypothetical protein